MSELRPRWYAPVMKHPWGKPMSRRGALISGTLMSVAAVYFATTALADDDLGPFDSSVGLVMALFWAWLAWSSFAHAVLHAPRDPEGPEGGA